MLQRCTNPKNRAYPRYGGRGILVCSRWQLFEHFLADMGEAPPELTLERKNGLLGYSPDNCVWATRLEQAKNRSSVMWIEFEGRRLTVTDWAKETGIKAATLRHRIRTGWSISQAMTTPAHGFNTSAKLHTFNGETLNIRQWARRLGKSQATIRDRLRSGRPLQDAFSPTALKPQTDRYLITHNGETHPLKIWAEKLDIKYHTLHKRLLRGVQLPDLLLPTNPRPCGTTCRLSRATNDASLIKRKPTREVIGPSFTTD